MRGNAYSTGACGKTLNGIDLSLRIFFSTCSKAKLSASSIEKLVSLSIPLLLICACSLRKDKRFCVTISSITTAGIYSSLLAAIACNCFRLPRSSEYEFSFLARFVSTITITIISPRTVSVLNNNIHCDASKSVFNCCSADGATRLQSLICYYLERCGYSPKAVAVGLRFLFVSAVPWPISSLTS